MLDGQYTSIIFSRRGESAVCDKDTGQCMCRPGIAGLRCNEVQDTYYVPMLHQFQYEIEDGYRRDGSTVRIGYDDAKFPGYSWRGYGSFSQLQDEVLLDIPVTSQSVYRLVYRYQVFLKHFELYVLTLFNAHPLFYM